MMTRFATRGAGGLARAFGMEWGTALVTVCAWLLAGTVDVAEARDRGAAQAAPATVPAGRDPAPHEAATARLRAVRNWAYQLQNADPAVIAKSPFDLVVVDYTRNGDPEKPLRAADVERMKKKPGGGRRLVLAYVSIGEAEDYRFYWDESWIVTATPDVPVAATGALAPSAAGAGEAGAGAAAQGAVPSALPVPVAPDPSSPVPGTPQKPDRWVSPTAPAWLGDENERWSGNFSVKYWEKGWQDLIFGTPQSFVERVLALGFDGVYLDRVDAYYEHIDEHPSAAEDMVDFVVRLAAAARAAKPGALVVPQNGEELLTRPAYVAAIDAIAKEDLLYGSPNDGEQNWQAQVANSLGWLSHATVAGRPILVIEYVDKPEQQATAHADLQSRGFVPYFGPRALDRLSALYVPPPAPAPGATGPSSPAEAPPSRPGATRRSGR